MPEVQNVGAVDYAQYQPSQYQYDDYAENYNMQPEIYDEDYETKKAASKSRLGATILGLAIIGGAALWGGHAWGKKSAAKELDQLKDAAKKYQDFADKTAGELEKQADDVINSTLPIKKGKTFAQNVKDELGKLKKALAETKEEGKDAGDKAADGTTNLIA